MAWTHQIIKKTKLPNGVVDIEVEFADGERSFRKHFQGDVSFSIETIKANVRNELSRLSEAETAFAAIPESGTVDTTMPTPAAPTQEQLAAREWEADCEKLRKAKLLVDMGVVAADNVTYLALKTKVTNNFKVAYINSVQL